MNAAETPKGWSWHKLGDLGPIRSGGTPARASATKYFKDGHIPWVKTMDLNNGLVSSTDECITELALKESSCSLHKAGTVLVAMYGGYKQIGRTGILGVEAAINQAISAIEVDRKIADPCFVIHWLNFNVDEWKTFAASSRKDPNITRQDVISFPILLPSLSEQSNISAAISKWDSAVSTTESLIAAKQQRKQALMQQLLTGKKRLPGFKKPWKRVRLDDVLAEVKRPVDWDDEDTYSLISIRRRSGGAFLRENLKGSEILTKNMSLARAGDFLISKMQVVHGAMGLVPDDLDGKHISGSYIALITRDPKTLSIEFFDWISRLPNTYRQAYRSSYGVHIEKMTFNLELFMSESIDIPDDPSEQKKIVSILDIADRELRLLTQQKAAFEEQKKALMSVLLTGNKRLKS